MNALLERIPRVRRIPSTISLGILDQAVLSLSSVVFLVIAANVYSPGALGVFTAATLLYQMATVVLRAFSGEVLLVLDRGSELEAKADARWCVQFSATVSLMFVPVGVFLLFVGGGISTGVGACLCILPGIAVQDTLRHVLIRDGRISEAFRLDLMVVGTQVALLVLVVAAGLPPWAAILALGVSPTVFGVVRAWRLGGRPSLHGSKMWRKQSKRFGNTFGFESIWGAFVQWATLLATIHWGSLADSAAFRSVIVLFGVTNVVTNFLRSTFLSHVVRQGALSGRLVVKNSIFMFVLIGVTVGSSLFVLSVIPDRWGSALLGDTWPVASGYLVVGAVARFAAASESVPGVLLRALKVTWSAARVRSAVGIATIVVAPVSVAVGGVIGGFIGLTCMSLVLVVLLFCLVGVSLRDKKGRHRR